MSSVAVGEGIHIVSIHPCCLEVDEVEGMGKGNGGKEEGQRRKIC